MHLVNRAAVHAESDSVTAAAPEWRARGWRSRGLAGCALVALVCASLLGAPGQAQARKEYDPTRAGNPLKIVYYAVYPAAFLVDRLIFRPAYYIGQWQPFHSLFGTTRPPVEVELEDLEDEENAGDS